MELEKSIKVEVEVEVEKSVSVNLDVEREKLIMRILDYLDLHENFCIEDLCTGTDYTGEEESARMRKLYLDDFKTISRKSMNYIMTEDELYKGLKFPASISDEDYLTFFKMNYKYSSESLPIYFIIANLSKKNVALHNISQEEIRNTRKFILQHCNISDFYKIVSSYYE